jgi:hypothetical protein
VYTSKIIVKNRVFYIALLLWLPFSSFAESYFTTIDQTDSSVTIHFSLPSFRFSPITINTTIYNSILTENDQSIGAKSFPDLPKFSTSILIPKDAQISFETIDSKTSEYSNIRIIPSAGNLKRQAIKTDYSEGEQYRKDEFYPASAFSTGAEYSIRNVNGISISVYPFSYNAVTKKLVTTTELTFTIYFGKLSNADYSNAISDYDNSVLQQFINYKQSRLKSSVVSYNPSLMLILSKSKYVKALQPFISWKNQKGISTELIITDSISTFPQYQNLIRNYYYKNKNSYVLLVGDSIDIPQRHSFAPSDNSYLTSDNAYGYIIGNDSYPEVIIGRLTANSITNISNQIQKILGYEKRTTNDSTVSNYLMVASDQSSNSSNEYDYQHLQKIADSLKTFDYVGGDELYDGSHGGADAIGYPTSTMFTNSVNNGKGLFFYTGHSSGNLLITSSFASTDAKNFTNTNTFPFGVIAGCRAGQLYQDTCIAEACMWANKNNKPTGMVALLASTVDQWWNPPMGGQDKFAESLIHGNNIDSIPTFGLLALKSFLYINDKYQQQGFETTDSWSIFGDPSLQIFTKKADSIKIAFNKNITIGQDTLTISTSTDKAWVCVTFNNKVLGIYRPNGGKVIAQFPSIIDTGTFIVTAYGFNLIPVVDSVYIATPQNSFIVIFDFKTTSKNTLITNGDSVYVSLQLKNIGKTISSSLLISASTNDTTFSFITYNKNIQPIAAGAQIHLDSVFTLHIKQNASDQSIATISITFTNNSNINYTIKKQFTINAPTLCYLGKTIRSTQASNLDDTADIGEINDIGIIISNEGHASAALSSITIYSPNNELFSYLKSTKPSNILMGETDTIYFTTIFSNAIANGENVPFDVICNYENRNITTRDYIKVGAIKETWENGSMSNFQWTNETPKSWFITNSQAYSSTHSLQSGAISDGQSTTISLSLTLPSNDSISFMAMTSCELPQFSVDHYIYYDYLDFRIDGTSMYKQAGITNWEKTSIPVTSGFHTLSWTYQKDSSTSLGTDNAWIDNIVLPYFKTNWQNYISIISTPDTQAVIDEIYSYNIISNRDPNATFTLIKSPAWLSLSNNILSGKSTKLGIDTIVISAYSNNAFTNQVLLLKTKNKVEASLIENLLVIYPNPASNVLHLNDKVEFTHYSISDYLGRIVQNGLIENNSISIKSLPNNAYILQIWNSSFYKHQLFIKQ